MVRLLVSLLATLVAAAGLSSSGDAYRFHAYKWPGGVVRYLNAAPDQAWAVDQAVKAWNTSGARVRFVPVSRTRAQLVIREEANKVYCAEGHATVGYGRDAQVVIFPAHGLTHACNRYWAARVMAHELGHVLGLLHEDRYCATMNATGSMRGDSKCPKEIWAWRCRLLEADDVAGVAATYGGTPRPPATPALCPLYPAIGTPVSLEATVHAPEGLLELEFKRPSPAAIPDFVVPEPWHSEESFVTADGSGCSHPEPPPGARYRWNVKPGQVQHAVIPLPKPGTCVEVWSFDKLGRPGADPAVVRIGPATPRLNTG